MIVVCAVVVALASPLTRLDVGGCCARAGSDSATQPSTIKPARTTAASQPSNRSRKTLAAMLVGYPTGLKISQPLSGLRGLLCHKSAIDELGIQLSLIEAGSIAQLIKECSRSICPGFL